MGFRPAPITRRWAKLEGRCDPVPLGEALGHPANCDSPTPGQRTATWGPGPGAARGRCRMVPCDGGAGPWCPDDVRGKPTGSPDGEAEGQAEVQDGPTPARQEMGQGEGVP